MAATGVRISAIRPNASTLTHDELDAMEDLDEGDLAELISSLELLRSHLPNLAVIGGCCGTDHRHVASLWGVSTWPTSAERRSDTARTLPRAGTR